MALYAVDNDELIDASSAEAGKVYWCLDCFSPVKKRLGKHRIAHFYHCQPAPSCRLYSKAEDHLLAQIQLQKSFPQGVLQVEEPFFLISRIADVCWEAEKIVFEIQCSPITEKEVHSRMNDYRSIGYDVIWLLDDKRYNKRLLRPAEEVLRRHWTYYVHIQSGLTSHFYDQFEVFSENWRVKKGRKLPLNFQKIKRRPPIKLENYPLQIGKLETRRYVEKDRFHRAFFNPQTRANWIHLEKTFGGVKKAPTRFKIWLQRFGAAYRALLLKLIMKTH